MRFIHAADAHIDSPLKGLETYSHAPVDAVRGATRQAFSNLIGLAIAEQVDFLVIAGDLFDGPWPDMQTGIWTAAQFRRLDNEGIAVYLLRGNHDAASEVRQAIRWPENVVQFAVDLPQSIRHPQLPVVLHGQGFAQRAVLDDLAVGYPSKIQDMFNIGVLHTSLTGSPDHDPYAPTSLEALCRHGYDYWALGHIHQRSEPALCAQPYIAYSGNLQGRHIRESGPKGCLLVDVNDTTLQIDRVDFRATDALRWHLLSVAVTSDDSLDALYEQLRLRLTELQTTSDGRFMAVRVVVTGTAQFHHQLADPGAHETICGQLRDLANQLGFVWLEKVIFDTRPFVDVDELRSGRDLLADLLYEVQRAAEDPGQLSGLTKDLNTLVVRAAGELQDAGIYCQDPAQLLRWLRDAESQLVHHLWESS